MESKTPVFINTEDLQSLLEQKAKGTLDLRILNCTVYMTAEEGDVILDHWAKHIPTAEYFDIKYIRDMSKPYPFMMPS